jgi:amino acid transporter
MFLRYLLGRRLSSNEESTQRVGPARGVAVFGLDALGSAAYGPEAALTVLLPAGLLGLRWAAPLGASIVCLLLIVYVSYRQTIAAYPKGGGAYTVAGENLGRRLGLLAGAALMLDYLLNVCVGISTGVGALISAVPRLQSHTLALCLTILGAITLINLRGTRESGALWMLPTYIFVGCLLLVIGVGCAKSVIAGGHPRASVPLPMPQPATEAVGLWLLLRAFAAGCTALTGVEAVSNGVSAFRDPRQKTARRTLTLIVATLAVLLLGISMLVRTYGITATQPGSSSYQSVLSMLTAAVLGRGILYYITIGSILSVLSLSANTSFAGFPRLCRVMADDDYLPSAFAVRGRRLAYSAGILALASLATIILIIFGGITDRLIPLFAIGAFLAFTLSQAGMVAHWRRVGGKHSKVHMGVNAVGATTTGIVTVLVLTAKFREGAWLTILLLGIALLFLSLARSYRKQVEDETAVTEIRLDRLEQPLMLVPIASWNRASVAALQFACSLSNDVRILHIDEIADRAEETCAKWQEEVDAMAERSGVKAPRVVAICSPYRSLTGPILGYVARMELESPDRRISVVIAETVAARWYQNILHNYRSTALKLSLFFGANRRVVIIDIPWQLNST